MFQTKVVEENRNTRFVYENFFRKSCNLWHNVEKYGAGGHATAENTRMIGACTVQTR